MIVISVPGNPLPTRYPPGKYYIMFSEYNLLVTTRYSTIVYDRLGRYKYEYVRDIQ